MITAAIVTGFRGIYALHLKKIAGGRARAYKLNVWITLKRDLHSGSSGGLEMG